MVGLILNIRSIDLSQISHKQEQNSRIGIKFQWGPIISKHTFTAKTTTTFN